MSASAAPRRTRVSTAPSSSLLVTKSLKRATTNANARPSARSFPVFTSISVMHYVAELVRFRSQVAKVVLVGGDHQRDPLHYLEPEGLDPVVLARAVADQADLLNADVRQNLGADPVVALINRESQSLVCLHGVHPLVLELVRPQLVDQADAPPLLAQVHARARAVLAAWAPSPTRICRRTPAGLRPATPARSPAPSVWPARTSPPPTRARSGKVWPGLAKSLGLLAGSTRAFTVLARSSALMPVVVR